MIHRKERKEPELHGKTNTAEYAVWTNMLQRCYNPLHENYMNYGGRGISVCLSWRESFQAFYDDVGPRPSMGYSLDRRDNDGNYCKSNCRWVTADIQMSNRRNTKPEVDRMTKSELLRDVPFQDHQWQMQASRRPARTYRYNGVERTLTEWSVLLRIKRTVLYHRLTTLGWTPERTFSTPEGA